MHKGFSHLDGFQHYRIINMTSFTFQFSFIFLPSSYMNFDADSIVVTLILGRWLFKYWTYCCWWGIWCVIKVFVIIGLSFANVMLGYISLKNCNKILSFLPNYFFLFLQDLNFCWIGHNSPHSPHLFPLNIPAFLNSCLLALTKCIPCKKLSKYRNVWNDMISMTDINLWNI